jgi:hypothetical protein
MIAYQLLRAAQVHPDQPLRHSHSEVRRDRTGAPGSPKRTWAENDIFRLLFLSPPLPVDRLKLLWPSPGFPVELAGVDELHAAFLTESRTREQRAGKPEYAGARGTRPSLVTLL